MLGHFFAGKRVVITAGGTREKIDAVRYVGNRSSGKMGLAVADCAFGLGAIVKLVTTVPVERDYDVVLVESADEMKSAIGVDYDYVIMAAAVSDFRVDNPSAQKIKKDDVESLTLRLVKNEDILMNLVRDKSERQVVVGFCAESENLVENAKKKILKKGCDFLVANDISRDDIGFSSEYNEVCVLDKNMDMVKIEKASKSAVAMAIMEYLYDKSVKNN